MRFTVHRPASAEVSPCCHRPPGGDVACRVHISVPRARIAGDTPKNRLALAIFRCDVPARRASLRRVRGGDEFNPPQSFVFQPANQAAPALATDRVVKAALRGDSGSGVFDGAARRAAHRPHIQIFHADGIEASSQVSGGFLHPISAPVGVAGFQFGNGQFGPRPPIGAALRPAETLLQSTQALSFATAREWGAQQFPGGQRRRHHHSAIHPDHAAVGRSRDRFWNGSEPHVPPPRPIQRHPEGLNAVGHGASPPEPHPSDFRHPDLAITTAHVFDMARIDTDLPESFVHAGFSPAGAAMGAIEEVTHGLREVPQGLLLHGLRPCGQPRIFRAGLSQLGTLLVVAGGPPPRLPVLLLFNSQVPHKPGVATMFSQHGRLLRGGKQSEPGHPSKLTDTYDKSMEGRARCLLYRLRPAQSAPRI